MSIRNCVVFGGSKGIGKAICARFLRDNFRVAVISRNRENVDGCLDHLRGLETNSNVSGFICDVRDESRIIDTVALIQRDLGSIDVMINAAGVNKDRILLKAKYDDIVDQISTNLIGAVLTSKAVLKDMIKRKAGSIINIGSIIGIHGNSGQCVYSASKAGLVGLTKSLAKEVGNRGIRVNLVAPGYIQTDMTKRLQLDTIVSQIPLQRIGQPEDVAEVVRFIVDATYVTGQVIPVDGGLSLSF